MAKLSGSHARSAIAAAALAAIGGLAGCVAAGIGGATYAVKASQRGELEPLAQAGDAEAQYKLGLSHCCMGPGFSTQTATEWLCKSAAQNYAPAMYELGRIYAGEVSRTPAPGQKVLQAARAEDDPVVSYAWFQLAADGGHEEAGDRASSIKAKLEAQQLAAAQARLGNWRTAACEYDDVFGANPSVDGR